MISIRATDFWDNIVVRPSDNGYYQLAYGHHRLEALRRLKIGEIDIPVKNLSDTIMLDMMARENYAWGQSPNLVLETVRSVRIHLNKVLAKYDSYQEFHKYSDESVRVLFTGVKGDFKKAKNSGVGRETIFKFLGEGYRPHHIQSALSVLDGEIKAEKKAEELRKKEAERRAEAKKKQETEANHQKMDEDRRRKQEDEELKRSKDKEAKRKELEAKRIAREKGRKFREDAQEKEEARLRDEAKKKQNEELAEFVDVDAYKLFPTTRQARGFVNAVRDLKIPRNLHINLARHLTAKEFSARDIPKRARSWNNKRLKVGKREKDIGDLQESLKKFNLSLRRADTDLYNSLKLIKKMKVIRLNKYMTLLFEVHAEIFLERLKQLLIVAGFFEGRKEEYNGSKASRGIGHKQIGN